MGLTCEEVAKNLCVDTSTLYRMVSKFNTTGELRPNKKTGAPSKLSFYDTSKSKCLSRIAMVYS